MSALDFFGWYEEQADGHQGANDLGKEEGGAAVSPVRAWALQVVRAQEVLVQGEGARGFFPPVVREGSM